MSRVRGGGRAGFAALAIASLFALLHPGDARADAAEGVRLLGQIRFIDLTGDGVEDWLVGRAECFSKADGEREVRSPCAALIDGRTWTPKWRRNVPRFGRFPPALAGSWVVLDMGAPIFSAFDTSRPELFYEFRLDGTWTAAPNSADGRILVVADRDHLYFVALEERRPLWDRRLWSQVLLSPVLLGGRAAVVTQRGLEVLDLATGKTTWRLSGRIKEIHGPPGEDLYVVYQRREEPHSVASLVVTTGSARWEHRRLLRLRAPLIVGQDQIFAVGAERLLALDRSSGAVGWKRPVPRRVTFLGADDRVLALLSEPGPGRQEVLALDRETGKPLWSWSPRDRRYSDSARLVAGVLVLWSGEPEPAGAAGSIVRAFESATGKPLWKHSVPERIRSLLSADASRIRVHHTRGFLTLQTRTGNPLEQRRLVARSRVARPLSERLRYLVYTLPPLIIVAGILVWLRRRWRRRR